MNVQLLEKRHSIGPDVNVDASRAEIVPMDEESTSAMLRIGYVKRVQQDLRHLASIGRCIQGIGTLGVSRGMTLLNQQTIIMAIQVLNTEIAKLGEKPKKTRLDFASMAQLAQAISRLSAQLTSSQKLLLGDEKLTSPDEMEDMIPRVKTFEPGAIVRPASCPTPHGA